MAGNRFDVAIVGIGAITPIGVGKDDFWEGVVEGRDGIREVPPERWSASVYSSDDRAAPARTYSTIGAFLEPPSFDRRRYRVPPRIVESMDPTQQMAVTAATEALEDAGVDAATLDRSRVGVIIGNALGGDRRNDTTMRIRIREVLAHLGRSDVLVDGSAAALEALERDLVADLPSITEDTMPGELSNCIAGRVCNLLDLQGPSYTVDAACASSMAALDAACHALEAGQCDWVISGGVDNSMGPEAFVKFAKIGALSATGSRPFDAGADGFVMGEGCGLVVLRRREDAERDGQRVYAVIRAIGASSDGRGKAITAPNPSGQRLAIERAYEAAGFGLDAVDYIEAHGTSTLVGDSVEATVLGDLAAESGRQKGTPLRLGSIKSQIGHLKSAAGIAGVLRAALSMHHGHYPPTIHHERPNDAIARNEHLVVQASVEPWALAGGRPRRAGVSAFGFGGTNFHVVMEGTMGGNSQGSRVTASSSTETVGEVVAFASATPTALARELLEVVAWLDGEPSCGLSEVVERCGGHRDVSAESCRLAVATTSVPELADQLRRAVKVLERGGAGARLLQGRGVFLGIERGSQASIGMLFPGQGAQYVGMLEPLGARYRVVAETFEEADSVMTPILGNPLTDHIFGKGFGGGEDSARSADAALQQTAITQPAVLACDVAMLRLLAAHGVRPDVVAGHSLGEYAACVAAGVLDFEEALRIVAARGREMVDATPRGGDPGWMAAVGASLEVVEPVLHAIDGYVVAANKNCPAQTIIAGSTEAVEEAMQRFAAMDLQTVRLPVSHAFHSDVVASASTPLRRVLDAAGLRRPRLPILSNVTGELYPEDREEVLDLLARQVASPVEFIAIIERMADLGVETFVEVGPKRALASFVQSILEGRPHRALFTNHPKRGELRSFHESLAALVAEGRSVQLDGDAAIVQPVPEENTAPVGAEERDEAATSAPAPAPGPSREEVSRRLVAILCEKTGYDVEEIEEDFELEADLGVDTVKQAEILAGVREDFGLGRDDDFRLADYPSVASLIEYVSARSAPADVAMPVPLPAGEGIEAATSAPATGPSREEVSRRLVAILCEKTGYDVEEIEEDFELEADLGVDTVKQAEILAGVREDFGLGRDDDFRLADYPSVASLIEYVSARSAPADVAVPEPLPAEGVVQGPRTSHLPFEGRQGGVDSGPQRPETSRGTEPLANPSASEAVEATDVEPSAPRASLRSYRPASPPSSADAPVITGVAAGLPGLDDPFDPGGFDELLGGRVLIESVGAELEQELVDRSIERVIKRESGGPEIVEVDDTEDVLHLAGRGREPAIVERYGISKELDEAFDVTTRWALAAAIDALRDAGLPLIPRGRTGRGPMQRGLRLSEDVGRRTGVLFGSAFPGYDAFVKALDEQALPRGDRGHFDRRFLVEVLSFAHAQVAQYLGAMGPNTQVNSACASTTIALAMAVDWIRLGRCDHVVVMGADAATSDRLFPFIGAGFLATGAATTERDVRRAARPFDRSRNGMILGMGAVALVVERADRAAERGVTPIGEVVATRMGNSAFHPMRIQPDHVASEVTALFDDVERDRGLDRCDIAASCVFMSHEPHTPARGGSAQAEARALRQAFGDSARSVLLANTKGYTGHAMGAGLEEFVALRSLERQEVPPVPHLNDPDPELADLAFSRGGAHDHDWSLRIAAGFGSQVAISLVRRTCTGPDRIDEPTLAAWAAERLGCDGVKLVIEDRHLRALPDEMATPPKPPSPRREVDFGDLDGGIRAWQVVTEPVSPLESDEVAFESDVVVVVGGGSRAETMRAALEARGAHVVTLSEIHDLTQPDEVEAAIRRRVGADKVVGLVDLLAVDEAAATEPEILWQQSRTLFHVARVIGVPERFVVAVTALGGHCGIGDLAVSDGRSRTRVARAGVQAGFVKALAREWAGRVVVKVVDLEPELLDRTDWCDLVLGEASSDDGLLEVGHQGPTRVTTALRRTVDGFERGFVPRRDSTVVLTGGAGGITAAVGLELVRRGVGNIAILDIAPWLFEHPDELDLPGEKQRVRESLKASGERVTPARVERELAPLRAAHRAAAAVTVLREAGAQVSYHQCDLADAAAVAHAIEAARARHGRIHGIVHGAGLEVSRALDEKPPEVFDRVFRGKALGAAALWEALAATPPEFFVAFSSVAGRFGNPGQEDYASANEVLARLGASAPVTTRALTVDWTAWDRIGMAAEPSMRALLRSRGVDLLPPEVGTTLLADLLEAGATGEVVVCGRLGDLASPRFAGVEASLGGWFDRVVERERDHVIVEADLDLERHAYLVDHAIDGVPVLPGVVGLDMMASTAALLSDRDGLLDARDIEFHRPVKVHPGRPVTIRVRAERWPDGRFATRLSSASRSTTGRRLEAEHFEGFFAFSGEPPRRPIDRLSLTTPESRGPAAGDLYAPGLFFHGPGFQVLGDGARLARDHVVSPAKTPEGRLPFDGSPAPTMVEPLAVESLFQACGLWGMVSVRALGLPAGIEHLQWFAPVPADEPLVARAARVNGDDDGFLRFDAEILDEAGNLLLRATGISLVVARPLDTDAVVAATDGFLERLDLDMNAVLSGRARDRLAEVFLTDGERRRMAGFRSDKRRREWLGGRVAAKHLVRDHLRDRYGVVIAPREIEVEPDAAGAPEVRAPNHPEVATLLPRLAISHCQDRVVVAVVPAATGARVGIDLEQVETRSRAFELNVLTDGELAVLESFEGRERDLRLNALWAVKESVSKALGLGLALDPREMEIGAFGDDGRLEVLLHGRARDRAEELGICRLEARARAENGDVFAAVVAEEIDDRSECDEITVGESALVTRPLSPETLGLPVFVGHRLRA